jgi:hypothetical protein
VPETQPRHRSMSEPLRKVNRATTDRLCGTYATRPCSGSVAAADVSGHWLSARLAVLELRHEAATVEKLQVGSAAIGGAGPNTSYVGRSVGTLNCATS